MVYREITTGHEALRSPGTGMDEDDGTMEGSRSRGRPEVAYSVQG